MEVDSWVSVQARRERFEQLYEDSPLSSPQNTSLYSTPRSKNTSNPRKYSQNSDECRTSGRKNTQLTNKKWDHEVSKYPLNNKSCMESSELNTSEKIHKQNVKTKEQIHHPFQQKQTPLESAVTPISSVAKRIPVFKPITITSKKTTGEQEVESPTSDTQGKRGRFFSHMRSRSHGNFVMKRDSSADKSMSTGQQNGVMVHKESKSHKDWLTPKCKQRSIDNLLKSEDSKSCSSFEGKQKLVSNIVKNMKNKETPTVLRKFSFSSKNEKDMKNIKEKSVIPNIRHKKAGTSSTAPDKSLPSSDISYKQKSNSRDSGINMDHKSITEEKTKSHTSEIAIVPVLIAKAVAEVASKRNATQTLVKTNSLSSLSAEDHLSDPPARPPRRRATGPGPTPKRKGKAPSPPNQSSTLTIKKNKRIHRDSSFRNTSSDESPDITSRRFRDSPDNFKSYESASSYHSLENSLENSHESPYTSSTPVSKYYKTINSKPKCVQEQRHRNDNKNEIFKAEIQTANLRKTKANTQAHTFYDADDTLENTTEVEGLPPGPPPKKPPRTFAYDIYKNNSMPILEVDNDDDSSRKGKADKNSSPPIYAVPKKKKTRKINPEPPIRSKSDLSREVIKPSVAPKPPHVLAKAKRASLVDPLSNIEKDEEATMTSEFQRQAHIRYSLRKPNQSPPTPSGDKKENNQSNSNSQEISDSIENLHDPDYSTIDYESENDLVSDYNRQKGHTSSMINSSPGPLKIKNHSMNELDLAIKDSQSDYEDISFMTPFNTSTENDQPLSLSNCCSSTPLSGVTYLHSKRSMSDETLYKGCRQEEPLYATPTFQTNNCKRELPSQKELHYMEADSGRDREECKTRKADIQRRERVSNAEVEDGSKGRSSLISAWKREFRQSYRQVQSRLKKSVIR